MTRSLLVIWLYRGLSRTWENRVFVMRQHTERQSPLRRSLREHLMADKQRYGVLMEEWFFSLIVSLVTRCPSTCIVVREVSARPIEDKFYVLVIGCLFFFCCGCVGEKQNNVERKRVIRIHRHCRRRKTLQWSRWCSLCRHYHSWWWREWRLRILQRRRRKPFRRAWRWRRKEWNGWIPRDKGGERMNTVSEGETTTRLGLIGFLTSETMDFRSSLSSW